MSAALRTATLKQRADEVEALLHAGAHVTLSSGLNVSEVRARVPGQPVKVFAYHVLRYMERTGRVRRHRNQAGLYWRLSARQPGA